MAYSGEDRRGHSDNHESPCAPLEEHRTELEEHRKSLVEKIDKMQATLDSVAEIVIAWNNAKGFINTLQTLGVAAKWFTLTGASVAAIWYWLHGGKS